MINKVFIIAPHPDDEINLAGGLFPILKNGSVHTTVVLATNGDYDPAYAKQRMHEAKRVKAILGYDELILLGYGDEYIEHHIYDLGQHEVAKSHSGRVATCCYDGDTEYCFEKNGIHKPYTKANYKEDLYDIILDRRPDLIICVDLDSHPDHRCLSLLFDECMCEVSKNESDYAPIVLKGFAYMGVWKGLDDFFDTNIQPVKPCSDNMSEDMDCCYPYLWNDRIRVRNHDTTNCLNIFINPIYRSLWAYKTQCRYISRNDCAIAKFAKVANPENCYWLRAHGNLALMASIIASSGETRFLNDNILCFPDSVRMKVLRSTINCWTPDDDDDKKEITISFDTPQRVGRIVLYQGLNRGIGEVCLIIDNKHVFRKSNIHDYVIYVLFPKQESVTNLKIRLLPKENAKIELNEIECYEDSDSVIPSLYPLMVNSSMQTKRNTVLCRLSKAIYIIITNCVIFRNMLKNKIRRIINK